MSKRRVRRPKEQEDIYKSLTDNNEFGIFSTYKDVFMLAGTVGFMEKKRKEFSSSAEGIDWNVFNQETDETVINAIALVATEDINILEDSSDAFDKKMKIFEEYAAGGLEIINNKIVENPKFALNIYFDFIMSMQNEVNDKDRNLKGIADMLSF